VHPTVSPEKRFWSFVKNTGNCWEWYGGKTSNGYGGFYLNGKSVRPHRFAYQLFNGKIPDGLTIDHLCNNKICVNPKHLEAVKIGVNVLRGTRNPAAINARRQFCKRGHPFSEENTFRYSANTTNPGSRLCKICQRERSKRNDRKSAA